MTYRFFLTTAVVIAMAASANAQWTMREFKFQPIATPDLKHEGRRRAPEMRAATEALRSAPNALDDLTLYPVAGTLGKDIFVPYYVDLDDSPGGERDFLCTDYTFDGHTGHDPYIRSFREQEIGVPIFAPLDGTVLETLPTPPPTLSF
jgi:hypothetical protein